MPLSTVAVPTAHATRYLQQLAKHSSDSLPGEYTAEQVEP